MCMYVCVIVSIVDSANGYFQGQIIGNNYQWASDSPGANIRRFDQCDYFQGCFPYKEQSI